jgi:hypothetical protein
MSMIFGKPVSTFADALRDLPEHDPEKSTRHSDRVGRASTFVAWLMSDAFARRSCSKRQLSSIE